MAMQLPDRSLLERLPLIVKEYQRPDTRKAVLQVFTSFGPFVALWVAMYFLKDISIAATLALAVVNAFFLVRIFIIQHDCGHQSFTKYRWLNDVLGHVSSFLSFIPYKYWAKSHHFHHGHNGKLWEFRDIGDIETLTVEEYAKLGRGKRLAYRIFRSTPVLFGIGPIWYMFVHQRLPMIRMKEFALARRSLIFNNIFQVTALALLIAGMGWKAFLLVHVPILIVFGVIALWFFYIQHQHEETYKAFIDKWDYTLAAIQGSTYYKLPRFMHWLTGNIGYHHIHHLNPLVPSYNLAKCHHENPIMEQVANKITFRESLPALWNHLWDEAEQRMISFREFNRREQKPWLAL